MAKPLTLRPALWLFLVAQATLLVVELTSVYDYEINRLALSFTNVVVTFGIIWFDGWLRRHKTKLMDGVVVLAAASVWLDAIGNFQHYYTNYWWWDHLTHGFGGLAATAVFISLYFGWQRVGRMKINSRMAVWFGFLSGQFLGALYEVSEYLGDFVFHMHRVGAGYDTSRDLTFNLAGGIITAFLFWPWKKK